MKKNELTRGLVVQLPELRHGGCSGCCYHDTGLNSSCVRPFTPTEGHSCAETNTIYVRDTPEARAAYIALKLEIANG